MLETRLLQAQAEAMAPIDLVSCLISDELTRRGDRLLDRRRKQAQFSTRKEPLRTSISTSTKSSIAVSSSISPRPPVISRHEDALFLGPAGTGKSHLDQAIGLAAIHQAIASFIAKPIRCWRKSPKPPSIAHVTST